MPVRPTGVKVTKALRDGETVALGETQVRVYAVPRSHTRGSAAYLVNGVLFLGDAADITDAGEIIGSPWIFSDSQSEDQSSLIWLGQLLEKEHANVTAIAFSHSGVRENGLTPLLA